MHRILVVRVVRACPIVLYIFILHHLIFTLTTLTTLTSNFESSEFLQHFSRSIELTFVVRVMVRVVRVQFIKANFFYLEILWGNSYCHLE